MQNHNLIRLLTWTIWTLIQACGTEHRATAPNAATDTVQTGTQGPKGDTGTPGTNGKDGAPGKDGKDGAMGPKGDTGATGAKGDPTSTNEWHDPITQYWWLIGANQVYNGAICSAPYAMPTTAQLTLAKDHGIFLAGYVMGAPNSAWTLDRQCVAQAFDVGCTQANEYGIFCVKVSI